MIERRDEIVRGVGHVLRLVQFRTTGVLALLLTVSLFAGLVLVASSDPVRAYVGGASPISPISPPPAYVVSVEKFANTDTVVAGDTIDYTVLIKLGQPRFDVAIEDIFLSGIDFVPGSARLDGVPIVPIMTEQHQYRIVYKFRLGDLPAGGTFLTYSARVDADKPCQGQKVSNEVHLLLDSRWSGSSVVNTSLVCPTASPTTDPPTNSVTPTSTPSLTPIQAGFQTRTASGWVNNQVAIKPLLPITVYTGNSVRADWEAVRYLKDVASPDEGRVLYAQMVAAKLNISAGADHACINSGIAPAEAFLSAHPYGSTLQESDRSTAVSLSKLIADYNSKGCP